MYIDDCIDGVLNLFETNYNQPLNIGEEQVSLNELIKKIEKISKMPKLKKIYNLDMPKGVRGIKIIKILIKYLIGNISPL